MIILADDIKNLAAEKVGDQIAKGGDLYHEAMAGEGLDQGGEAQLRGTISAAYNADGAVQEVFCRDVGKLILKNIEAYIMPTALEQAETELI